MKILISNDDGFQAPGIVALHDALKEIAEVEVVAPEHNNSAKSNALTLAAPLYVQTAHNGFRYVNGTPTDCVHLALTGLLDDRPDLVVSGINNGANMGDDTIYSGTVAAAMEGFLFGIPAIAFSQIEKGWAHIDAAARRRGDWSTRSSGSRCRRSAWLLNVNVPNLPFDELQVSPACVTPGAPACGRERRSRATVLAARPCTGSGGAARAEARRRHRLSCHGCGPRSVTPLQIDLTDHATWGSGATLVARLGVARVRSAPTPGSRAARRRTRSTASVSPHATNRGHRHDVGADPCRMIERLREQGMPVTSVLRGAERGADGTSSSTRRWRSAPTTTPPADRPRADDLPAMDRGTHDRTRAQRQEAIDAVLEIGTGCGYQTAVLAHVAKHVYSVERIAALVTRRVAT